MKLHIYALVAVIAIAWAIIPAQARTELDVTKDELCKKASVFKSLAEADMYWFLHLRGFDAMSGPERDAAVITYTNAKASFVNWSHYLKQNCR